jgi:hypothetical protein
MISKICFLPITDLKAPNTGLFLSNCQRATYCTIISDYSEQRKEKQEEKGGICIFSIFLLIDYFTVIYKDSRSVHFQINGNIQP